ncbi:hypothetical protein [Neobacillus sp. FSL H8-0543]|uniref:hypothetical protein n=1 Tax=Neobacillus sp. FSL H8-0543 TaxID=2954672 RepID=UPI00315908A0
MSMVKNKTSMFEKMLVLKEEINGEEAELFKEFYYGKFFSGSITLIEETEAVTLVFYKGNCIDVVNGVPNSGLDIGVSGSKEAWDKFVTHKSLSVATNKGNSNNLSTLGGAIRFRQNFNVVAQLIRVFAGIR